MVSIHQPIPRVMIDGVSLPGEVYDRCAACSGRIDADEQPILDEYDWWCVCPLKAPPSAAWALGEAYQDESGLPCWYSPDGEHIYKPYPSPDLATPLCAFPGPKGEPLFSWPNSLEPPWNQPKISVQEQAARYREIKRVLWSTGMGMTEKIALLETYEMTGRYPGVICAGGCVEPVSINMSALGERMGCSRVTAGRAVQSLADHGLLVRTERYEDGTGHKIISTAPARRLAYKEVLAEPEHKLGRERGYRRCSSCGSERVEVRHLCHCCGTVEATLPPADAQDQGSGTDLIDQVVPTEPCSPNEQGSHTVDLCAPGEQGSPAQDPLPDGDKDLSMFYAGVLLESCEEAGLALKLSNEMPARILAWPPAVLRARPDLGLAITNYREALLRVLDDRDRAFETAMPAVDLGDLPERLQGMQGTLFG